MKRSLALLLCCAMTMSGCGVRTASLNTARVDGRTPVASQEIPASYVERLPVGRQVEVRLKGGERFKATFMGVEGEAVRVQRTGRIPVPPEVIPLEDLAAIRVAGGGTSAGKAILLGAVAGAAAFFGLFILSIAAWASN